LNLPTTTIPFNGLFSRTTWVSQYQKGKTSLDLNETRDDGVLGWNGISINWTICKQSAPCSRLLTTPTPHHSIFTGWMLFPTSDQQCQRKEGNTLNLQNSQQLSINNYRLVQHFYHFHISEHDGQLSKSK